MRNIQQKKLKFSKTKQRWLTKKINNQKWTQLKEKNDRFDWNIWITFYYFENFKI